MTAVGQLLGSAQAHQLLAILSRIPAPDAGRCRDLEADARDDRATGLTFDQRQTVLGWLLAQHAATDDSGEDDGTIHRDAPCASPSSSREPTPGGAP